MSSYWKVNKATSSQIIALSAAESAKVKAWIEFSKSLGASDKSVTCTRSWGRLTVCGFKFDKPPAKGFYLLKNKYGGEECWVPRAGTSNRRAMDAMQSNYVDEVCKLIGFEPFQGLSYITPGINFKGDYCYVVLDDKSKPNSNCRRISDLTFNKLFPQKKKAA